MDWKALYTKLAAHHQDHPQRAELARLAVDSAVHAIAELAKLGHNYHLVEGPAEPVQEWPKWVYNLHQDPRIVHHQSELDELGDGWYDHPEKPAREAALAAQFKGRGGVDIKGGLPAPIQQPPASPPPSGA